ncbi:unnamed protein product [Schistosoma margrebowiei]|uniref:Uncharacterized protein n=1 Tax=Schistosoma margrebowiei TaxID=48269 RepID=A0A183LFI5_9TREM|nr:unnamed protein product [Schistosoma margrebowiei]
MRTLSPVSTRIQHRQVALPRELSTCTRVFIRVDSVRKPWQQPYEGSFHVIAHHEKTFKVDRYGRVEIVSNQHTPCLRPSVWFRRLQSTLAKAGLATHALVNALSRYIGFECLAYAWSRTWSLRSLLAQRGFVLRLQRFWSAFPTNAIFRFWIQTTRVACQLKQQIQHIAPSTVFRK